MFSIIYGISAKNFDLYTPSVGDPRTIVANRYHPLSLCNPSDQVFPNRSKLYRLSFLSLCLSAAITYSGVTADYFVYYSPSSRPFLLFIASLLGLSLSFAFALLVGVGLATAIPALPLYSSAYSTSQGALLVAGLAPLNIFGKFCAVLVALSVIANLVASTYSSGLNFQLLASWTGNIPRFIWNTIGAIIYTVCALAGRKSLSVIFTNFLALMGYWAAIWIAITLEEHVVFRWWGGRGWNWKDWDCREKLPMGIAALVAFLVGWTGAILCMAQAWYVGPIAKEVGVYGVDVSSVSFAD